MDAHTLEIIGDAGRVDLGPLQKVAAAAFAVSNKLGLPSGTINLSFVDDEEIRRLNREYSGNDYATDVLSFNYLESGDAIDGVIGEMAISLDTARTQAAQTGLALESEIALLALHGLLHLAGYDHQDQTGRDTMGLLQRELMEEAGVAYREFEWQD